MLSLKLRLKTLLITGVMVAVLLMAIYAVIYRFSDESSSAVDANDMRGIISDARMRLNEESEVLARSIGGWASWDDTYNFMETKSEAYVEGSLEDATLAAEHIDFIGFYGTNGSPVLVKSVGGAAFPTEIASLSPEGPMMAGGGTSGLILTERRLSAIASAPILTSKGEGPTRGVLILGRQLHDSALSTLGGARSLASTVWIYGDEMPQDALDALHTLSSSPNGSVLRNLGNEVQAGYFLVSDVYGRPVALVRLESLRLNHIELGKSMGYIGIGFAFLFAIFVTLNFVLLDRFVLLRLKRLDEQAEQVGRPGSILRFVEAGLSDDELSHLAHDINRMIFRLRSAQKKLLRSHINYARKLDREVKKKTHLLAAANARLKRLEENKNQFLFNVGHELKSPLSVIEMNLQASKSPGLGAKERAESERMIGRNIVKLKEKIEEIIQLTRFEHHRSIEKQDLDFSEIVRTSHDTYEDFAEAHKAKINLASKEGALPVTGDKRLLQYAIGNLFSNAVKYCEGKDINASVVRQGGKAIFSIENYGKSVSVDNRKKLFKKFFKEDQSAPGTGVGLFMTREIAKIHSGDVWYENIEPQGSRFYFSIPLRKHSAGQAGKGSIDGGVG